MDRWMDKEEDKQGFGPVIGCHRMGEKGEDDKKKKDSCMFKRESGGT